MAAGVRAVLTTPPVSRSGRLVGMLSTHHRTPRRPTGRDLHVTDLLVRQAADYIEQVQGVEELRRTQETLRQREAQLQEQSRIMVLAPIPVRDLQDRITIWNTGAEELTAKMFPIGIELLNGGS